MTVSRAINGHRYVKEETREKILAVIERQGYVPNIVARSLRTRTSKTIGLIINDIENPYYARLAKGAIITCEKDNYNVIVCNSDSQMALGKKYISMLLQKNIDGLLIATLDLTESDIANLHLKEIPFVLITCKLDLPRVNYFISDDYAGGCMLSEYLIGLGHRRIFFLRGMDTYSVGQRIKAFTDTMEKHGIPCDDSYFSNRILSEQDIPAEIDRFIRDRSGFTAIMAVNDYVAISTMEALRNKGYRIPDDISVVGYDDLRIASLIEVPLTTVRQPQFTFGENAAQRLIQMINNPDSRKRAVKQVVTPELIVRKSCRRV